MPVAQAYTTAEDGEIHASGGVADTRDKTSTTARCYTSSSSGTVEYEAHFFHDTSVFAGLTITAVTWNVYVDSSVNDGLCLFQGWTDDTAAAGTTLEVADYRVGQDYNFYNSVPPSAGWNSFSIPVAQINTAGYTNVIWFAQAGESTTSICTFQTFENASGNKAYFEATYTTGGVTTPQLFLMGRA